MHPPPPRLDDVQHSKPLRVAGAASQSMLSAVPEGARKYPRYNRNFLALTTQNPTNQRARQDLAFDSNTPHNPSSTPPNPLNAGNLGLRRRGEMVEAVGWLVCPVIKIVVDKAKSCASDRIRWLNGGVPDALERLANALVQLRAVAGTVERRSSKDNKDLLLWLQQLKDAVYEADDVLDDFGNKTPQLDADGKVSRPRSSLVKIGKRLLGADESLNRLKDVVKKLDALYASCERLMQAAGLEASGTPGELSSHRSSDGRATGSVRLHEQKVFGRDRELQEMVSWLVSPSDGQARQSVPIAAIMGHGGMGKTTLAQRLFEDKAVASTFDLMMWVRPAAMDDELELARQILHSADIQVPEGMRSFDWLQKTLRKAVSSRSFLLVVDDVWNREDMGEHLYREMWSKVLAPLGNGKPGSRIVVTTRGKIVAKLLDASKQVWLDGLPLHDIWSLFKTCAFGEEDIDKKYPALGETGKKIAEKLKGSPMAAKAVGQMLEGSHNVTQWRKVLEMDIFDNVSSTLELCYRNLPEHLQPCFAICSIFPKNWRFKRDKLVKIWMALDFVRPADGDVHLGDVGRDYFDQLVVRSFFHKQRAGRRRYYYIHDLMHDLAGKVSRFDCARVEGVENREIPKTIRHLSVSSDAVAQLKSRCDLKRLRTFLILKHPSSSLNQLPGDLLAELKGLRVLGLEGCDMVDLSERIGHLKHLRYLALCRAITTLPQTVAKLSHLQTLSIPKRSRLEELPKDIVNLKCLRHLDMDTSKIVGIGKLVHLQGSIEFHVKKEKGHTLEDLNDMSALRKKLHIKNLDLVTSRQEACQAGLSKKQNVKVLELEWNSTGKSIPSVDAEVLDGLEPHQNVEELHIRRYHGNRSPSWLNISLYGITYLKSLYLTNCRKWEVLPPLGQLPCLEVLHMKEMCSLKQISGEFYGTAAVAFPCLVDLEFDDMMQWVKWTKEENNMNIFPKLRKLKVLNCPELIKVPSFPPSVRKVTVENAGFVAHMKLSSSSSSSRAYNFALETCSAGILTDGLLHQQQVKAIVVLTLRHCQDVKYEELQALTSLQRLQISHLDITNEQLGTCLRGLQSLTSLEIVNCSNITSLPQIESPSCLTKFHELHIRQCSQLSSLHSLPSFVALESTLIENCSNLTVESFPTSFNSLNSLRKLSIMYCANLESLPSGFPSSLQVLHLIGCKPVLLTQLQLKDGPEWDKVACIPIKLIH